MKIYTEIVQNYELETEVEVLEWVRGVVWSEIETTEQDKPAHSEHIDTIEGVDVYYDYAADYYFFVEAE